MNDRYLYKAKRKDNGEWVIGFYFCMEHTDGRHTHHFIIPLGASLEKGTPIEKIQVEVDPSIVCQCTGKKDKNVKLIWENDIICLKGTYGRYVVKWDSDIAGFILQGKSNILKFTEVTECGHELEVIGNIIDNQNYLTDRC